MREENHSRRKVQEKVYQLVTVVVDYCYYYYCYIWRIILCNIEF